MAGQKFQYDESGGTFFYFLLSFLALLLVPGTYYWWPRKNKPDPNSLERECHCKPCQSKRVFMQMDEPWKKTKQFLIKLIIVAGWLILILLTYKVSQFDYEVAKFDPYDILGVSLGSSQAEIKRAYRKLSLELHPDKETGDEGRFMELTKAYQALTDEEARRNYEKYGNPDGPGATSFGIALPSWIVEKKNSVWVLGLYALVFMVALPTVVGMWWYTSIRYSGDKVLLDTTQLYYYFFHKTQLVQMKRVIMILGSSHEFDKKFNNEIVERPTDNVEIPQLIKQLYNLGEKNKEKPLCFPYSIKARALIHAHLYRIPLKGDTLEKDCQYIVKKCPYLIQEMVNCLSQLILLAYARRGIEQNFYRGPNLTKHLIILDKESYDCAFLVKTLPSIETIENVMKLCPMIVQALWECKNPLLQLPHFTEDTLKHFQSKKRHIRTIQQFVQLKSDERRSVLKNFTDEQYNDVMKVAGSMPYVECQVRCEVIDDEATTVYTAGAIITVTVQLSRQDMQVIFGDETVVDKTADDRENGANDEKETESVVKKPVWQKNNKKSKNMKSKNKNNFQRKLKPKIIDVKNNEVTNNNVNEIKKSVDRDSNSDSQLSDDEAERSDDEEKDESQGERKSSSVEDDDTEWEKFQTKLTKRDKVLEGKSKVSHTVHCPYFIMDKQEHWWVYVSDRKSKTLLTAPLHITGLVDEEVVQLKFTAPKWPGKYIVTVCLRSDSYLGADQMHEIKLDVIEAPEVPVEHPQWDNVSDIEEDNQGDNSDLSEFTTDEDIDEQE